MSESGAPEKPIALALIGPTAIGKTALSLSLCKRFNGEVISLDSALVYRGMDIGTAKPSLAERAAFPHHLIDIRDPAEPYSAAEFRRDALELMRQISHRGKTPILVGGTMLYLKALIHGLADLPTADPAIRAEISALAERDGWPAVHAALAAVDPESAARLNPGDSQRLQRALEVYRMTGESLSGRFAEQVKQPPFPFELIQLAMLPVDRSWLHGRIEARFTQMIDAGFVDEVRALHRRGDLHPGLPSVRCVGYRQAWAYLEGNCSYQVMVEKGIAATRQLAKRQLTWLRSWPNKHELSVRPDGTICVPLVEVSNRDVAARQMNKLLREAIENLR